MNHTTLIEEHEIIIGYDALADRFFCKDCKVYMTNKEVATVIRETTSRVSETINRAISILEGNKPYDPNFGDDRICKCGHPYYRHFDGYDNNAPVGCKYCGCGEWRKGYDPEKV